MSVCEDALRAFFCTRSENVLFSKKTRVSVHPLPPFLLERWFVEFEFISEMRDLIASDP